LRTQNGNLGSYYISSLVAFFLTTTICAGLVFALATQALPRADDFCRAAAAPFPAKKTTAGVVDYGKWSYYNWSGRWAGIGFETSLLSSTPQPKSYPWLLLLLIAAQVFLLYMAIKQFLSDSRSALCLTALLASVYWANLASIQQGVFWITGGIENQLSVTLALFLLALLLSPRASQTARSKLWKTIVGSLLCLILPAFHELLGGILVLILSAITMAMILSKTPNSRMWVTVWAAAVIGFLIVFLAPGNAIRLSTFPNRAKYTTTFKLSLETVRFYLLPWCLDFKLWLIAVLLWLDPRTASLRRQLPGMGSLHSVGSFCCIWLSLVMTGIIAAIWSIGEPIPARTMNLIYGVFFAGWIVMAFLLTRPILSSSIRRTCRPALRSITLILLSALIVSSNNTVLALTDIVHGRARSWNVQMNRRFEFLKSAARGSDLKVETPSVYPLSYSWDDITEDPSYWSNQCVSQYFGAASVRRLTSAGESLTK
jgi:hypothetical protein